MVSYALRVHTIENTERRFARARRTRDRLEAVERALDGDLGCAEALQTATLARGALDELVRGSSRLISGSAVAS
ncbi:MULTISPECIES: hypothetical protein [Sorangium]|uniref:Uncharacterized protein n=1 Tax=Sorangium cellulosum TaxID=56 RepID=A0A4P2QYG3_SORCE|nr:MULTISPECIES: hypothetical protein [Sorangium]AUX35620.1 uncharacterized protein SOCE836_078150 [Sorangium cellulosum]WCQ94920.1 hypothetical protein NQZ70_07693 [Sorangium sp. Soce836]